MKNFKIVMILVAAVAMFCSCGDPDAPTVTVTGDISEYDLAKAEQPVVLTVNATAPKGIENVSGDVWGYKPNDTTPYAIGQLTIDDFTAGDSYNGTIKYTLKKEAVKDYEKVLFQVIAKTKKDVEAAGHYTVTIKPVTETAFTWKREGTTVTGNVEECGLVWGGTTQDLKATFKPVDGGKLYVLSAADYANGNAQDVANLLASKQPVTAYYGISASTANQTLTDVLATVHGDKTHLIKLETAKVVTRATNITVTGTYKVFDTVNASSSK